MLTASANRTEVRQDNQKNGHVTRIRNWILLLLCVLSMVTYLDRVCFGAAAPEIAQAIGLSDVAQMKWAFTAFALAYALFEIPSGWAGDRLGPRLLLIRIVIWWSACTILTGTIGLQWGAISFGGLGTLIVLRFLFGAGEAGAYPNITRAIHDWFPKREWEFAQGAVWMTGRLMGGVTPLIWAVLVGNALFPTPLLQWRGAFFLFGALGFAWCVGFALWFRNSPAEHSQVSEGELALIQEGKEETPQSHKIVWSLLLTNRSLHALSLMYALVTFVWIFNITYLPAYLLERFQVEKGDLLGAIYCGAPLWLGAVGCFSGGFLVSRFARRTATRAEARQRLGVVAMLLCSLFWVGAYWSFSIHLFCLLVALSAFCIDLTVGSAWASCQDIGRKNAGVAAATMNMVGTFGAAFAGWLTGTLIQNSLAASAAAVNTSVELLSPAQRQGAILEGYDHLFLINIFVFLIAAVCWMFVTVEHPADDAPTTPLTD
ncbi:MFS transporter [Blastopirellula sp. JC732]|uniref:MFS transporter n=1 Tax=Blastopirellula sediminis TaxID=2894196 RepID=A0A9X1MHM6_9BACT|nr:MFS transporter [Blastopirellula sediminis]MCC9608078.1 MFS transporter [Blastopirellula sediminis]MCC9627129.1 MFS transporter [Blastopirellula sediminis]